MNPLTTILSTTATALLAATLTIAAPTPEPVAKVAVGVAAPAFSLTDTAGKAHTLKEYEGKIVILEWYNPGCPWCRAVYDNNAVQEMLTALKVGEKDADVVYLAINSTGNAPKERVVADSIKEMEKNKVTTVPVLIDYDGAVGKAYGAKTTPHMFIIDASGVLQYQGAFGPQSDYGNRRRGGRGRGGKAPAAPVTDAKKANWVLAAVTQLQAGEKVAPNDTQPWGCGVKYTD